MTERKNIGETLLEYNAVRPHLELPEYGRHIQNIIRHAKEIEDPAKRQEYIEVAIELMNQMLPGSKTVKDIEDKLWNHLFFIADYDLDVKVPEGVTIHHKTDIFMKPGEVEYPQKPIKYRHYGWNVHNMIEKAMAMEPGTKRDEFAKVIAAYMKLAYRNWSKEQFVNDEHIKSDLRKMSKGELDVPEDAYIDHFKNVSGAPINVAPLVLRKKPQKNQPAQPGQGFGQQRRFNQGGKQGGGKKNKKRY